MGTWRPTAGRRFGKHVVCSKNIRQWPLLAKMDMTIDIQLAVFLIVLVLGNAGTFAAPTPAKPAPLAVGAVVLDDALRLDVLGKAEGVLGEFEAELGDVAGLLFLPTGREGREGRGPVGAGGTRDGREGRGSDAISNHAYAHTKWLRIPSNI